MKKFDATKNRTLAEIKAIIAELKATGNEDAINLVELVRDCDGTYYCNMTRHGKLVENLPQYVDFRTLANACKERRDAVELPPSKSGNLNAMAANPTHICK